MDFSCCDFFKAVSDPNRVKILMLLLKKKEMTVGEICAKFDMKQPSISHHLGVLKGAKVVESRKEGKEVHYKINSCCISACCGDFMKTFAPEAKV